MVKIFQEKGERLMIEIRSITGELLLEVPEKNLSCANLCHTDLSYANLRCADLRSTDLRCANLSYANLSYANLSSANLTKAYLNYANLRGANLRGANLNKAYLSWCSHQLISEILLRATEGHIQRQMLAGLVRINTSWCWQDFLNADIPEKAWALAELRKWVNPNDDDVPEALR
jgi:uncharacterized protein YjbI with pentapeptide repeats